jgi:hypothetical protein
MFLMIDLLPRPLNFPSQLERSSFIWASGHRAANQFPVKNLAPLGNTRDIPHEHRSIAAQTALVDEATIAYIAGAWGPNFSIASA